MSSEEIQNDAFRSSNQTLPIIVVKEMPNSELECRLDDQRRRKGRHYSVLVMSRTGASLSNASETTVGTSSSKAGDSALDIVFSLVVLFLWEWTQIEIAAGLRKFGLPKLNGFHVRPDINRCIS